MGIRIELLAVVVSVMQADVLRGWHALNVRRSVVSAVEIHVVTVRPRNVRVNLVPQIPLIRQAVGRVHVASKRLIDGLIAAHKVTIQRHQSIARPQGLRLRHTSISSHE